MSGTPSLRLYALATSPQIFGQKVSVSSQNSIAKILDQFLRPFGHLGESSNPLQKFLLSHPHSNLREAILSLPTTSRQKFISRISEDSLQNLLSISQERHSKIFQNRLFAFGQEELKNGKNEIAGLVFEFFKNNVGAHGRAPLRERALANLDLLGGHGSVTAELEHFGNRFFSEALHPGFIIPMVGAGIIGKGASTFALERLAFGKGIARFLPQFLKHGLPARFAASSFGLAVEAPAFVQLGNGFKLLQGEKVAFDIPTLLKDSAKAAITLGSMRLAGFISNQAFLKIHGLNELGVAKYLNRFQRFSQVAVPYAGMFLGMLGGHKAEEILHLRAPVGAINAITSTFTTLVSLTLSGKIGHFAAGRRFAAWEKELGIKAGIYTQVLEGKSVFQGGFIGPKLSLAKIGYSGKLRLNHLQEAKDLYLHTNKDLETGPSSDSSEKAKRISGTFRMAPTNAPKLPERTGKTMDAQGQITDPFEPILSPKRILTLTSEFGPNEILTDLQEELIERAGSKPIDEINEKDLGRAFGLALQERIHLLKTHIKNDRVSVDKLPNETLRQVKFADEIITYIEYFYRSNPVELLDSYKNAVDQSTLGYYEPLKAFVEHILGPHFKMPSGDIARGNEVIPPEEAAMVKTSGDMMSNLRLIAKHIRPGGFKWRVKLFALARQQPVADEINHAGTYRGKPNLRNIQINYSNEPKIIAVGPNGYHGFTQEMLERTVRLQFINLPSRSLHELLSREGYFKHLPEGAILVESIGALLGRSARGIFQPNPGESNTVLPYQLILQAARHFGRPDVKPVTMAGFLNGRELWRGNWDLQRGGNKLRIFFAGPEAEEGTYEAPEAELVARAHTSNRTLNTPHLEARIGHQQHSAELGKAAKNLSTTICGFEAVDWALKEVLKRNPQSVEELEALGEELQKQYSSKIRDPQYELMETLLKDNEKDINPAQADYPLEVRDDYEKSAQIDMVEVVKLVHETLAKRSNDLQGHVQFLENKIVNHSKLASTRNPKRGMMQKIMMILKENGCPYRFEEMVPKDDYGKPKMTEEGVNSFEPLMELYNYPGHPIERRRLDDRYYHYYKIFFPNGQAVIPPKIPEFILKGLNGELLEMSGRKITRNQLVKALEGQEDIQLNTLNDELAKLVKQFEHKNGEKFQQQLELILELISAMKESHPIGIDRSPILRNPYGNMFVIHMADQIGPPDSHRVFVRVDGNGIINRLTQLGMMFRSFPEKDRLTIRLVITGLDLRKNPKIRFEIEETAHRIISSFDEERQQGAIRLYVNDTRIQPEINQKGRGNPDAEYFKALGELTLKLDPIEDQGLTPQFLRTKGSILGRIIDNFLQESSGWPINIGYLGGPLQRAIKAAMTRKEKGALIGIYQGNQLIDAFTVYRYVDNHPERPITQGPMVLSHSIMKRLSNVPILKRDKFYKGLTSEDFFRGITLRKFLKDYGSYADMEGLKDLKWRWIPVQSLPLERALAGEINGVNPALLRIYFEKEPETHDQMIREMDPFYEKPFDEEKKVKIKDILNKYLVPFYEENKKWIDQIPLFQFFEQHGDKALPQLIREGSDF